MTNKEVQSSTSSIKISSKQNVYFYKLNTNSNG